MRRFLGIAIAAAALLSISIVGVSAGVSGPAFYVDGEQYRTVGTPTDFSNTGAPDHSFDIIYDIDGQLNVAEAAPGDKDYNGGRWMVMHVEFGNYDAALATYDTNDSGTFDSAEEVEAAIDAGDATVADTGIRFECPVIPMPRGPKH